MGRILSLSKIKEQQQYNLYLVLVHADFLQTFKSVFVLIPKFTYQSLPGPSEYYGTHCLQIFDNSFPDSHSPPKFPFLNLFLNSEGFCCILFLPLLVVSNGPLTCDFAATITSGEMHKYLKGPSITITQRLEGQILHH